MTKTPIMSNNNQSAQVPVTMLQESALDKIKGKYRVVPCKKTWLHSINPNHDGATIFSNSQIWIVAERVYNNGAAVNTGLTPQEEREFEQAMNLKNGDLSAYNKATWGRLDMTVRVPKEGLRLDCDNNIKHKLIYKMLLVNSKVAKSKEDAAFRSDAEVMITSEEMEAKTDSKNYLAKGKAYAKFNSMSLADKTNYLKVYNEGQYKVSRTATPDFVDQAIGRIIETNAEEFLASFDNPYYKEYILLEDLLAANIVLKKGGKYHINGGVDIGTNKTQVVLNLVSDDFQDTKIGLIAKLEAQK